MKKTIRKKLLSLLLASTMLLGLAACAGTAGGSSQPADGNTAAQTGANQDLKSVTMTTNDVGFDLGAFGLGADLTVITKYQLYSMLMVQDHVGQPLEEAELDMAESYTIIDDKTVEVKLYDYIHDSKGNPIKAEDVVFSYNQYCASGDGSAVAAALDRIEVVDENTLIFHLSTSAVGYKELVLCSARIISKQWYENASAEERSMDPATTGPYYVEKAVSGSTVVLKKLDNYWQTDESKIPAPQKPNFDEIRYLVVSEAAQRVTALESGDVDAARVVTASIGHFMNEDGTAKEGWTIAKSALVGSRILFMNMDPNPEVNSPLANNIALRHAIAVGCDRDSMRLGAGETDASSFTLSGIGAPCMQGYNPDLEYYQYDPELAKELLAEAGYKPGELTLRVLYSSNSAKDGTMTVFKQNMADIGINIDLMGYDQGLFNSMKYDPTAWDMIYDFKKSENGFTTSMYTQFFDSTGWDNGAVNFSHDKKLEELALEAANNYSQEACDAFNIYLRDQYQCIAVFTEYQFTVAQDGITEIGIEASNNPNISASLTAENYRSVVK